MSRWRSRSRSCSPACRSTSATWSGRRSRPEDPDDPDEPTDATASELLQQAEELFNEAEAALTAGDLGTYQAKIDEARALVAEALDLIET